MFSKLGQKLSDMYSKILDSFDRSTVLVTLIISSLVTFALAGYYNGAVSSEWLSNAFLNLSTEIMGAIIAFVLFDLILGKRQEIEKRLETRQQLIQTYLVQMQSGENSVASVAASQLKMMGCFQDGTFNGINLEFADLSGASLYGIDLQDADLCNGKFHGTNFNTANLSRTDNSYADFSHAYFRSANLCNAYFGKADLEEAEITKADLRGANLKDANMKNIKLTRGEQKSGLMIDDTTILPDGTQYVHENGVEQLERFINPRHPQF